MRLNLPAGALCVLLSVTMLPLTPAHASTQVVFSYTGANQTWTVPSGVTSVQVTLLGAGGGGGQADVGSGAFGGGGGAVSGRLSVQPGDALTIIVGQGGINDGVANPVNRNYRFGGGASGAGNPFFGFSWGSGGGRSAVRSAAPLYGAGAAEDILTAGAGGGGGFRVDGTFGAGGSGGGLDGGDGGQGGATFGGGGGTQDEGGRAGGPTEPGAPGIKYAGGFAQRDGGGLGNSEGGGGGGGYYGGGGAGDNGGGGGGSSFLGSLTYFDGDTTPATGRNAALPDLPAACGPNPGRGAEPGRTSVAPGDLGVDPGGDGCVVITLTDPSPDSPPAPRPSGPTVVSLRPAEHALGFDANGGSCAITSSGLIVDGVWTRVPTAEQCTRSGYTLLGWNPKPDGSDPLGFDPGGWTVMTDDNVLYAIWVPVR